MKIFTCRLPLYFLTLFMPLIIASGCGSARMQRGAAIGSGAGATVGALIGKTAGNTALGTIIGGAIGGTAGAYIGHKMDDALPGDKPVITDASVSREGDGYLVKFDKELMFDKGGFKPDSNSQISLRNLAAYLKHAPQANVTITGYADTVSTADYSKDISLKRAEAVKTTLVADSVNADRLTTKGIGETGSNTIPDRQARNRSVDIIVITNDKARAQAKEDK